MQPSLSSAVKWTYNDFIGGGVTRKSFLASHAAIINLFLNVDDAKIVDKADGMGHYEHAVDACARVMKVPLGRLLFSSVYLKVGRAHYIRTTKERLDNLIHHDFDEDEFRSFEKLCIGDASQLAKAGIPNYEEITSKLEFYTEAMARYHNLPQRRVGVPLLVRRRNNHGEL